MALSNPSFDSRLVTTISAWVNNSLADLITGNNPLFLKMRMNGNVRKGGGHGGQFVEPIAFPDTSGPSVQGVSNPYTALTFVDTTNMTGAAYPVAEKILPISVAEYDLNAQGSDTEKVALVQAIMDISVSKFNEALAADLWAKEETAGSTGSRSTLASIRALLNAGTSATTDGGANPPALTEQVGNRAVAGASTQNPNMAPGGISRAAAGAAYWCTPVRTTSETLTIQSLSALVSLATRGNDQPDLIVLPRDLYDKLQAILSVGGSSGGQMFSSKLADAGFAAIRFRNADVVFDDRISGVTSYLNNSSTAYGENAFCINTKYIKLRAVSLKPDIKEFPDPRPIRTWTAYMNLQITSGNLGRVHSRHVNLS